MFAGQYDTVLVVPRTGSCNKYNTALMRESLGFDIYSTRKLWIVIKYRVLWSKLSYEINGTLCALGLCSLRSQDHGPRSDQIDRTRSLPQLACTVHIYCIRSQVGNFNSPKGQPLVRNYDSFLVHPNS